MELAFGGNILFLQQPPELLVPLVETGDRLIQADPEPAEFVRQERPRHADLQPPAGHRVQHADFARDLERMIENRQDGAGNQARLPGPLRCRREEDDRVGAIPAIGVKIMLDGTDVGIAIDVGEIRQLKTLGEILRARFFLRLHTGEELHPEFHRRTLLFYWRLPRILAMELLA